MKQMRSRIYFFRVMMLMAFSGSALLVSAQVEKVYMPTLETLNLKKDFQYSTTKLLKNYIESGGRFEVTTQSQHDSVIIGDEPEKIREVAREKGTKYFISGSLNRLGETVIINVNLYETQTGSRVWFDQLKASSPDDFDPVFQRIGKNIGTANKAAAQDDIYSVTKYDSKELARKNSNNRFGVALGGIALVGQQAGDVIPGIGMTWSYDNRTMIFELTPSWYFSSRRHIYNFGVQVFKPFSDQANSWFAGGGFAVSGTTIRYNAIENRPTTTYVSGQGYVSTPNYVGSIKTSDGGGLMLMAGGGYIFNRTSSSTLRASLNYIQGLYEVGDFGYTGGAAIKLEIFW